MKSYTKPRGTKDIFGSEAQKYSDIVAIAKECCHRRFFEEIITPTFESNELFTRGIGESTDIVNKEMYTFNDHGGRLLTLRPEGTAGVVRAYIENKMYAIPNNISKFYYYQPMFRYERPQLGRLREFRQFGVEIIGVKNKYSCFDLLTLLDEIFEKITEISCQIKINSLGDEKTRQAYIEALKMHLEPHLDTLCDDCKRRFSNNPLRILDCKVDQQHQVMLNLPKIEDFLSKEDKMDLEWLVNELKGFKINAIIDNRLVRGLDYYSGIVFELYVDGHEELGAVAAGGCYDKLVKELGGPDVEGCGFAIGIDRISSIIAEEKYFKKFTTLAFAPLCEEGLKKSWSIAPELYALGFEVKLPYQTVSIKNAIKDTESREIRWLIIIGEDEINKDKITIRDLNCRTQRTVKEKMFAEFLGECAYFDNLVSTDYYENITGDISLDKIGKNLTVDFNDYKWNPKDFDDIFNFEEEEFEEDYDYDEEDELNNIEHHCQCHHQHGKCDCDDECDCQNDDEDDCDCQECCDDECEC